MSEPAIVVVPKFNGPTTEQIKAMAQEHGVEVLVVDPPLKEMSDFMDEAQDRVDAAMMLPLRCVPDPPEKFYTHRDARKPYPSRKEIRKMKRNAHRRRA